MHIRRAFAIVLFFSLFLCFGTGNSQEDGWQWINRVGRAYSELSSYQFEGVILSELSGLQSSSRSSSFARYAKPKENRFRYQAGMGESRCVFACDANSTIVYVGSARQYVKKQSADINTVLREVFKGDSDLYIGGALPESYATLKSQCVGSKVLRREMVTIQNAAVDCVVVEAQLTPQNTLPFTRQVRTLWIDAQRSIVLRDVLHTEAFSTQKKKFYDAMEEIRLSSYRVNEAIEDSVFQFDPPRSANMALELNLPPADNGLAIGTTTESNPLIDLNGKRYFFKELRGAVVLLDFWATWCAPCLKEMASLEKISARYKDKGLLIFGVNQQQEKLQMDFLKKKSFSYPMLSDRSGLLTRQFRASELPTLVVIDRNGRVVDWEQGIQKPEELESLLKLLSIQ
jgi:thiol-disulfide isomerase/thioredoxin